MRLVLPAERASLFGLVGSNARALWRIVRAGLIGLTLGAGSLLGACSGSTESESKPHPKGDAGPDATPDGCAAATCASAGADCGKVPDACGGTLDCGACTGGLF